MASQSNEFLKESVRRGYRFDNYDNLVNPNGKIVSGWKNSFGYRCLGIKFLNKTGRVAFHRLKAYFLFGDAMFIPGIQVRHLNGNLNDWSNTNIVLGTQKENMSDIPPAVRMRTAMNATSYIRKITKHQREEIRELYKNTDITMPALAKKYGVKSKGTVCMIIHKTGHYKIDKTPEELMS